MESFKAITVLLGDLWLGISAIALLIYHQIRLGFRVSRLEDRERETKDMVKNVDQKLDKIYLYLISHDLIRKSRHPRDDDEYE